MKDLPYISSDLNLNPPRRPSVTSVPAKPYTVEQAYKCRVRRPWWRVPLVDIPHMFLTYMNADTPRLCSTRAGVHHLNSVYGVYLRPGSIRTGQDLLPIASLNSMSMLGAETIGRAYGAAC